MEKSKKLKNVVKEKYNSIAQSENNSCCGSESQSAEVYNIMTDDYTAVEGYNADADLSLGCGLPTQFAKIQQGDTVIDLGSGAGKRLFYRPSRNG